MKDTVLVVPTIRENSFKDFTKRWNEIGLFDHCDLIVMEDNPEASFEMSGDVAVKSNLRHYDWSDIEKELGTNSWIIPRRSDTVRSFGYYMAAKLGYKLILTLDDDCYPPTEEDGVVYTSGKAFVDQHRTYLTERTKWFNTLNEVKPRGIPFYNLGKNGATIVNHGLWTNVLDYDAPYQLANPIKEKFSFDNQIVPNGLFFPMCGMNVMWKAEATVLMYHLLMGQTVQTNAETRVTVSSRPEHLVKLPFDRFGDIWCGILMKRIADVCRLNVSTGMPYIRHERASNPFANLKKEANGLEVNEKFWDYIDHWQPTVKNFGAAVPEHLATLYKDLGNYVKFYNDFPEHSTYFAKLGNAMNVWADLFLKLPRHKGTSGV